MATIEPPTVDVSAVAIGGSPDSECGLLPGEVCHPQRDTGEEGLPATLARPTPEAALEETQAFLEEEYQEGPDVGLSPVPHAPPCSDVRASMSNNGSPSDQHNGFHTLHQKNPPKPAATSRVRLVECGPQVSAQRTWHSMGATLGAAAHMGGLLPTEWARTATGQWVRVQSSTVDFPNRERDKQRVESCVGLPEFGDISTEFYAVGSGYAFFAVGYDRIVYGDHGPYVEFSPEHIFWPMFPNYVERPESCFYDEYWTADGSTMLYFQKRPVKNKPNPPIGPWSVQNNRREGYANYVPGKLYVACEAQTIAVRCVRIVRRRRKRAGRGRGSKGSTCGDEDALANHEEANDWADEAGEEICRREETSQDREEEAWDSQHADREIWSGCVGGEESSWWGTDEEATTSSWRPVDWCHVTRSPPPRQYWVPKRQAEQEEDIGTAQSENFASAPAESSHAHANEGGA